MGGKQKRKGIVWIITDHSSSVARIVFTSNTKVDITNYHVQKLPEGVIQNGILYDSTTAADILEGQVKKVLPKTDKKEDIGELFIVLPPDKVKSAYIYIENFNSVKLSSQQVERIEEAFQVPITKLRFFWQKESTNAYLFHAIRHDIAHPFLLVAERLNLKVSAMFPSSTTIAYAVSNYINYPTIAIYAKDDINVIAGNQNRVWVHKPWTIDYISLDNLEESIKETQKEAHTIMGTTPQRILIVENNDLNGEDVEQKLKDSGLELTFFHPAGSAYIDPIDLLIIKGLLTLYIMEKQTGFTTLPLDEKLVEIKPYIPTQGNKKEILVAFLSTILAALMLITGLSLAWEFYIKRNETQPSTEEKNKENKNQPSYEENVKGVSNVEITLPPSKEEKVEENKPQYTKSDIALTVLNGNGKTGEAKRIAKLLQDNGFAIEKTDNADRYNYPKTVIISPSHLSSFSEEIKGILSQLYPLTYIETNDAVDPKKIVIILGAQ